METDRELLELAAKAFGIKLAYNGYGKVPEEGSEARFIGDEIYYFSRKPGEGNVLWNPLTDDGDALRLAVKLNLQITPGTYRDHEATAFGAVAGEAHEHVHYQQDLYAATRRAIVRAAAAISKEPAK